MKKTDVRTDAQSSTGPALTRRHFIGAFAMAGAAAVIAPTAALAQGAGGDSATAQAIADHFSSVKTMQGQFVQFGPRGDQTSGKFFIQRPGKLRFNYDAPSRTRVICDGSNVLVTNDQLRTSDMYPLSKTPLSLLLANKIDLSADMVRKVDSQPDVTRISLGNRTVFGDSIITMIFDTKTYDLRQWTVTDAQGKDTAVIINNVRTNVSFDDSVFRINYNDVHPR